MTSRKQLSSNNSNTANGNKTIVWLYEQVTGDEDIKVCKDIPEKACRHQPGNFFAYLVANLFGKIADELASARLTLPWLLSALGAPGSFTSFLVPIREAGVLIPQLFVAAYIRTIAIRKKVWLVGATLSAAAMFFMAVTSLTLTGAQAGWAILLFLVLYSLARGLCSVSAKDVLGKTISKTQRGTLMGYSMAISSILVLAIGLSIQQLGDGIKTTEIFYIFLFAAALCWLIAIMAFAAIREQPGETENGDKPFSLILKQLTLLRSDKQFQRYVVLRVLLLSVALIPPFYVILAQQHSTGNLSILGLLIIANGLAGACSAVIWGKMSDRSSRSVMAIAALLTAVIGLITFVLQITNSSLLNTVFIHPLLFFFIIIAHAGVRLGRKVYLVDMANTENRSAYVAVSNTVIGITMLLAGSIGIVADLFGIAYVILLLSAIALYAAFYTGRIADVSG